MHPSTAAEPMPSSSPCRQVRSRRSRYRWTSIRPRRCRWAHSGRGKACGEVQQRSWAVLKAGGVLASATGQPQRSEAQARHARGVAVHGAGDGELLTRIGSMIDAGQLKVHVGATFALADAAKAQQLSALGHGRARLVLEVLD